MVFVFENSHFGHLKVCFSAPSVAAARPASSIRVRHMAQRGGLISRGRGVGVSDGGMAFQVTDDAIGGRGGIRTHGTLAGTPVFKTGALNRSATLPSLEFSDLAGVRAGGKYQLPVSGRRGAPVCAGVAAR
jgi:hypothetical protein